MHKNFKVHAIQALSLPLIWTLLLIIEIFIFASQLTENTLVKAYEAVVFSMSFLFFTSGGVMSFVHQGVLKLFGLYALQFFFWWLVAFMFITIKNKKRGST